MNKGRALCVLGVFARDWEKPCPNACAAARPARHHCRRQGRDQGPCPGPGVGVRVGLGSNPARFFLNRATRVWCTSGS